MMTDPIVNRCQCELCQQEVEHAHKALHQQINELMSRLDEQQRRWLAGLESVRYGHGGDVYVAQITGLDEKTIRRGRQELQSGLALQPTARVRQAGAGRPSLEKKVYCRTSPADADWR